jgi:hypothetical protein
VWEVLLVLGGAAILGYVKRKVPDHAPTIAYAVFGATCVAILIFTFTGHFILSRHQPETTPDNIEENIRTWGEALGLGLTKLPTTSDTYFNWGITLKNGNFVVVDRAKALPGYLQIQSQLVLSPENQAAYAKLTKQEVDDLTQEVSLELARSRMGYGIGQGTQATPTGSGPQMGVLLVKGIPITNNLTEAGFAGYMDEIDSAISIVRATTTLALHHSNEFSDAKAKPKVVQK